MWQDGLTQREIGERYGVKRAAVHKCIRRYSITNGKMKYGHSLLLKHISRNPNATHREMAEAIGVCETTVGNYLDILESKGKIKRVKFIVTES